MRKTQVYSWRLTTATKAALESEARREGESLAALLDRIASEWLNTRQRARGGDESEQTRLRATARRAIGAISGGDPRRAERARVAIRQRLTRRRAG